MASGIEVIFESVSTAAKRSLRPCWQAPSSPSLSCLYIRSEDFRLDGIDDLAVSEPMTAKTDRPVHRNKRSAPFRGKPAPRRPGLQPEGPILLYGLHTVEAAFANPDRKRIKL